MLVASGGPALPGVTAISGRPTHRALARKGHFYTWAVDMTPFRRGHMGSSTHKQAQCSVCLLVVFLQPSAESP